MAGGEMVGKRRVCVTGAGGFIGSWLVKILLQKGFQVHATVRDPSDEKNAHLMKLENATENLHLFKATLFEYDALHAAIVGCEGVFHTASPVPSTTPPNPEEEVVRPAVEGTLNILKACSVSNVKRVVMVSSTAAVSQNPSFPKDKIMDEDCWSDKEFCKKIEDEPYLARKIKNSLSIGDYKTGIEHKKGYNPGRFYWDSSVGGIWVDAIHGFICCNGRTKSWYCLSKTLAEESAWSYAKQHGRDIVVVCPSMVTGPMLQSTVNSSSSFVINLIKGNTETMADKLRHYVDVRDVAAALVLVYEKDEASGRYVCAPHTIKISEMVRLLKSMYPNFKYPKNFTDADDRGVLSSEKLKRLGWKPRPLDESFKDAIECYIAAGLLDETIHHA